METYLKYLFRHFSTNKSKMFPGGVNNFRTNYLFEIVEGFGVLNGPLTSLNYHIERTIDFVFVYGSKVDD